METAVDSSRRPLTASTHTEDDLLIGRKWSEAAGTATVEVVCPRTEEVVGRGHFASVEPADKAVWLAWSASDDGVWPRLAPPGEQDGYSFGLAGAAYSGDGTRAMDSQSWYREA